MFDLYLGMTKEAQYMAGGHVTNVPTHMTYTSVISCDTVRIGFLVAAFNGLDILAVDIKNSFLEAPTQEKIFFYDGNEWKYDKDRVVVVICALCVLKYSALQFRKNLAENLVNKLGFKYSLVNPYLWYKAINSPDGFE